MINGIVILWSDGVLAAEQAGSRQVGWPGIQSWSQQHPKQFICSNPLHELNNDLQTTHSTPTPLPES